ncbi:hypothetical protein MMC10_008776 [Thelotrema lepadinum]|nr:hypothetical protein [Thelotrema lepadinum]
MPPKKTRFRTKKDGNVSAEQMNGKKNASEENTKPDANNDENITTESENKPQTPTSASKKRKQPSFSQDDATKSKRRSSRGAPKPSTNQVLHFLLSHEAIDLCRPQNEIDDLENRDPETKSYSTSKLNPFEELLSAVILSRPISHALGVRSIRTILNEPYNFTTPKAVQDAGPDKRLQALWDAKTQHKDKTAAQLGRVADMVVEKFSKGKAEDASLEGVREAARKDMDEESDLLTNSIKGIGKTGMSIFFRRIQWLWPECYPYVDERTEKALIELGLPPEPEELRKLVEENWDEVPKDIQEGKDIEARKRRAFVIALERATGAQLENNINQVLEMASKG